MALSMRLSWVKLPDAKLIMQTQLSLEFIILKMLCHDNIYEYSPNLVEVINIKQNILAMIAMTSSGHNNKSLLTKTVIITKMEEGNQETKISLHNKRID